MDMTTKKEKTVEALVSEMHGLRERTKTLADQAEVLERQLRAVRGTRDLRKPTEYRVGDEGPTAELMAAVQKMLGARVMSFQELLEATGARPNRIKGVIMRLQREGVRVVNLGTEARALWFAPSDAVWARLQEAIKARKKS